MMNNNTTLQQEKTRIAIFASGTGSNAQKIIDHFSSLPASPQKTRKGSVALIVSNNPKAGVLKIAEKENIPFLILEKKRFYQDGYLLELKKHRIDLIVLAGFMWKVPMVLLHPYQNKIVNIHPALLPKFGGKNMYGNFVHEAVIKAEEKESGITIHYVDEIYDHGKIIFQARCKVDEGDTPETLAKKIHALEHKYYSSVIEKVLIK